MKLRTKLLVSIITATMALSPLSSVFAANHANKAPKHKADVTTEKTKKTVHTTTVKTKQPTVTSATYVTPTTTTVQATVYGDVYKAKQYTEQVNQVKALLAVLLANPKDPNAKAEINKLITTKKDLKIIAKAISELKHTVIQEMKTALKAKDKVAFKTAQQKIKRLNDLAKQFKQEIVKQAKLAKQAEQNAKKAIQQLNNDKQNLLRL